MEVVPLNPDRSKKAAEGFDGDVPAAKFGRKMKRGAAGDFDCNHLLFGTKGTYGYGNAIREEEDEAGERESFDGKTWRPLTQKLKIPAAILSPYRLLIGVRAAALALFLTWRITHKNGDAIWLWGISLVCELWFALSWLIDQLPKLSPIDRAADLSLLHQKFESPSPSNPTGKSDLPSIDIFVSTSDPDREPPLITANTILSILAADYPVEKLTCYLSDDAASLLTFESIAQAASFASLWVPFCRKHRIEPRNPDSYFSLNRDPYKNKLRPDFVRDRRRVKREYDEFKVRINSLLESIRRRSDGFQAEEELKASSIDPTVKIPKATWMADGSHWPGAWANSAANNSPGDHSAIIQVMLKLPQDHPILGGAAVIDLSEVDIRLPMLVYASREKRSVSNHHKKAGAMNALLRASAIMSNGPFVLNLDCDHYIYNSQALRQGMCFMMDRGGDRIGYVQFPQRFEGIDSSDRYANHNTVFFEVNMRALDGLQGPLYVGTGCLFRRIALYGFGPPRAKDYRSIHLQPDLSTSSSGKFGNSIFLLDSIPVTEYQGRPLADHPSVRNGRPFGALMFQRDPLDASTVAEAINVVSCLYEEKTEWGTRIGWIYGSVTEHFVTGYRMHNRGWRSIYCATKGDAFRGKAPINLTDRLHQVLRSATGSVEIFFSRNNALFATSKMKFLQRLAYFNLSVYPFSSFFLTAYCFLPALSLFSEQFIVQSLDITFLVYLLVIALTLCLLAISELRWSGIELEEWWQNEQFWFIGSTSAHLAAVLQGLLKSVAGIKVYCSLTSKSATGDVDGGGEENDDELDDRYAVKWTWLMVLPLTIILVNLIAIAVGVSRTLYSIIPQWSRLLVGLFFSFWVLAHLYPFAKGLMGRRGRTPTIVFIWSGLIAITISLLWVAIKPPSANSRIGGSFFFL
ncbi:cellulose synthase-like protein D3 [Phalaenopsis equestris]|uniref:cellulose synthase-like protein D3 n=1 Tax=Phalaenopsis equestris TaxID=78828 RepID=UPI0009E651A7|nr:cellulose synthase-like protein D3 [Phalaenopsis equestris]